MHFYRLICVLLERVQNERTYFRRFENKREYFGRFQSVFKAPLKSLKGIY